MLRLNLKKEPHWIDLVEGVRVKVLPFTSALMSAASTSAAMRDLPRDAHSDLRFFRLSVELAKIAIVEWEGVGDAEGAPVEPSPEGIDALMDVYLIARAFAAEYVTRGLLVSAEKNG